MDWFKRISTSIPKITVPIPTDLATYLPNINASIHTDEDETININIDIPASLAFNSPNDNGIIYNKHIEMTPNDKCEMLMSTILKSITFPVFSEGMSAYLATSICSHESLAKLKSSVNSTVNSDTISAVINKPTKLNVTIKSI